MRAEGVSDAMLLRIREAREREFRVKESMLPLIPTSPSFRTKVSVDQMGSSTNGPDSFFLPPIRPAGPRTSLRPTRPGVIATPTGTLTTDSATTAKDDSGPTVVDVSPRSLGGATPTPFNPTRPSKPAPLVKGFRRT